VRDEGLGGHAAELAELQPDLVPREPVEQRREASANAAGGVGLVVPLEQVERAL
jgi:hypothetical protein